TGITGQDGDYLSSLLLQKGYQVYGLANDAHTTTATVADGVELVHADLRDAESLQTAIHDFRPTEVYNLAAQSSVGTSLAEPVDTINVNGMGAIRLLEACRHVAPSIRFLQSSTSELFGDVSGPQDETAPIQPRSPYAIGKTLAHHAVHTYRDAYSMF